MEDVWTRMREGDEVTLERVPCHENRNHAYSFLISYWCCSGPWTSKHKDVWIHISHISQHKLVLFKAGSSLSISPDDRSGMVVNPSMVTHEAEGAWSWVQGQHWLHNKTLSQKKRKEKMVRRKWWIVSLSTRSGHVWITTQWKNGNCDTVPWEIAKDLSTESNAVSAFHNH